MTKIDYNIKYFILRVIYYMILENKKRLKNNLFIKNEFKNIDKKVIIFFVCLFINLLKFDYNAILFVSPFLVLGYLLGFQYLIIVIMGCFVGSIFFSPLAFYQVCLFVVLFLIGTLSMRLLKTKIYNKMLILSFLSDLLGRYIFEIGIKDVVTIFPLIYSLISLLIRYVVIRVGEYLLNEEKKQYPYLIVLGILVISSLSLMGLDYYIKEISILFIVLSIFFLFIQKILDFSIYGCFLFINFLVLLLLNKMNQEQLFLLFIPCLISSLSYKKKWNILIYLLVSLALLLLMNISLNVNHLIIYIIIVLFSMLLPSNLIIYLKEKIINPMNNIDLYEKKYQRKGKEIEQELSKFSELFNLVVEEYDNDNISRLERRKEDILYHNLCINCRKSKECFTRNDTLKKLMFKSIEGEINEEEAAYINKECTKPSKFYDFSNLLKKDYYREYKYNLEYQGLKEALKNQMNGISKVLDNYRLKLQYDDTLSSKYENERIKSLLDKNQVDYLFVDYNEDFKGNSNINLCVKVNTHQDIYKIRDLLINEFNINYEIKEVSEYSLDGFLKIEFKELNPYKFLYGVYQINLSEEGNGDSYLVYENNNYMIYSLSDGMGSGKKAKEESRFTLKILKSVLDTGMDLKNGIMLMNSLLKIKNRYDIYASLDLVSVNKKNLKSHFFKNGAMHSYIYSMVENRLTKISGSALPIGIVDNITSYDYSFKLKAGDSIIMFSDGIKENIDLMESFFKQIKDYNPQIIAREIATHFKNEDNKDDVSVLVIKIEK